MSYPSRAKGLGKYDNNWSFIVFYFSSKVYTLFLLWTFFSFNLWSAGILLSLLLLPPFEFSTPNLTNSFSLKFEWQQVSKIRLGIEADLDTAVVWIAFQSLYQAFGDCSKSTNYNWYHHHFHFSLFPFQFSSKVDVLIFSTFTLKSARTPKLTIWQVLFFLMIFIRSGLLVEIWWSFSISKSQRNLCISFSKTDSGLFI